MRSTPERDEQRSYARRAIRASALAAALGVVVAVATVGVTTARLIEGHEEKVLAESTRRLAIEIEEEEGDGATSQEALDDELGDVENIEARGAIHVDGRLVAGDPALPRQEPGTCGLAYVGQEPFRVCATTLNDRVVTLAASAEHTQAVRRVLWLGSLIGLAVGLVAGALLGRRAARSTLAPFLALRDQVRRVRPDAPSSDALSPPAEYDEIEDLRAAVADLVDRLGASLSQAQRFASHASHELRTPLTTIAGELDLLAETACDADAPGLVAVRDRVRQMGHLVERLLVLAVPARAEGGEAVDLADVVEEVVAALPPAQRPRVAPRLAEDVVVRGDPALLRAAVGNLVENALKFSSGEVDVRVSGTEADASVEVTDDGPGIPAADRPQLFETFFRSGDARRRGVPGSGIGLALVAHIARGHGGRAEMVDVRSGACLRVVLPRWSEAGGRRAAFSPG